MACDSHKHKPGKRCCGCCLAPSELPLGAVELRVGPAFSTSYWLYGTWQQVGVDSCVYRLQPPSSVTIPDVTQIERCVHVAEAIEEYQCNTHGYALDLAQAPISTSPAQTTLTHAVLMESFSTFEERFYFRYRMDAARVAVYLAKRAYDCGDGERCRWVVTFAIEPDPFYGRVAGVAMDQPTAETVTYRTPNPDVQSCRSIVPPHQAVSTVSFPSTDGCTKSMSASVDPWTLARSVETAEAPVTVDLVPGANAGCLDANVPASDDEEVFEIEHPLRVGGAICAPSPAPPIPTVATYRYWDAARNRWQWFDRGVGFTTPHDTVSGCLIGGVQRFVGSDGFGAPIVASTSQGIASSWTYNDLASEVAIERPTIRLTFMY